VTSCTTSRPQHGDTFSWRPSPCSRLCLSSPFPLRHGSSCHSCLKHAVTVSPRTLGKFAAGTPKRSIGSVDPGNMQHAILARAEASHHLGRRLDGRQEQCSPVHKRPAPACGAVDSRRTNLRCWRFMTVEAADREFIGNLGYDDDLGKRYTWTSNIANGRTVSEGDLVILQDKHQVLGLGWIDFIDSRDGCKVLLQCPQCETTAPYLRKGMTPPYRCRRCAYEFEKPVERNKSVTIFVADYGRTWRPLSTTVSAALLSSAFVGGNNQHSIREVYFERARLLLSDPADIGPLWWDRAGGVRPEASGGFRQTLQRQRIGQAQFRSMLRGVFGDNCAISGQQPPEILEAAHLYRYSETPHHDARGGLLLRRDLHVLFDRWLIAIDTTYWTLRVAPKLLDFQWLAELNGKPLRLRSDLRPDPSYLDIHMAYARDAWSAEV
jgi:hypothetical protein